jgi:hypothetical protein
MPSASLYDQTAIDRPPLPRRRPGVAKLALPGILLALACLLPYLNKAFTIDDPPFLTEAQQILRSPLHPWSYEFCWGTGNQSCVKSGAQGNFGPAMSQALMGYLLVPTILAGGSEWIAHALQLLLACLAVFEMVRLALRLGCNRLGAAIAGLLLVAIPPFLPMASTAMPDVVALTLALAGIERLLAWKVEQRWHQAVLAAIMLGFAPFARPHLILLLPLGALWLFHDFRLPNAVEQVRRQAYLWAPLLVAACITLALNLVTRSPSAAPELSSRAFDLSMIPRNLYAYLLYLSFPIPLAATWLLMHCRKAPLLLILPVIPIVTLHLAWRPSASWATEWPTAAVICGLVCFCHLIHRYWSDRDWTGLLLVLWLMIPLPAVIYQHLPIKYLLPVMPAIVLILIRTLSALPRRRALVVHAVMVVTCAAYSCLILKADSAFAEFGRQAAAALIAPRVAAGEKVWFGGQWGFFWYAQQAGAKVSKSDTPGPFPGELLAVGLIEGAGMTRDRFPNRQLVDSRVFTSPYGWTMVAGAGMYSNAFGDALWVWDPRASITYELWRIK